MIDEYAKIKVCYLDVLKDLILIDDSSSVSNLALRKSKADLLIIQKQVLANLVELYNFQLKCNGVDD